MDEALRIRYMFEVKHLAQQKRAQLLLGVGPIGDNLFKLVREAHIKLVYYPLALTGVGQEFLAGYFLVKEPKKGLAFIALNTAQSYDHQLFSLAHQLYHHWTEQSVCVCYSETEQTELAEFKANRFATEFLLPTPTLLKEIGRNNDGKKNLFNYSYLSLLRFVALLHCDYKLPYRAIIQKLWEDAVITVQQFIQLQLEEERSCLSMYYKVASQHNTMTFERLNEATYVNGVDGEVVQLMLRHFEQQHVTGEEFTQDLRIVAKTFEEVYVTAEDGEVYFSTN